MNLNSIYLRRRRKVYFPSETASPSTTHLATLLKNLESLGVGVSPQLLEKLQTLPLDRLLSFHKNIERDLQLLLGAHRPYRPFYPNFPIQVMSLPDATLYLNAMLHYHTNSRPNFQKDPRPPLLGNPPTLIIDLGSKTDFDSLFTQLASSRTSLSPQDKLDLAWFISQYRDSILPLLPPSIPHKENLAHIAALLLQNTSIAHPYLAHQVKTPTDVLRIAAALSEGDVSLAEPTKYKKFPRPLRKYLLAFVEAAPNPAEDILRFPEPWKRLGERLHPREHAAKFPITAAAFDTLRNHKKITTFNRTTENLLLDRQLQPALQHLATRPGELARRLDHLLRLHTTPDPVLEAFHAVAERVSTPVLLQVLTHFEHRTHPRKLRAFFPKGQVANVFAKPDTFTPLPTPTADAFITICRTILLDRFAKLPPLGPCYLDPALKDFLVPFSQRSASKALRTVVRGSKLPLPDAPTIRFFLWWKNGSSRTDIDLSAAAFDTHANFRTVLSYYNLKDSGSFHSGDIVDAPQGAAEFIDINVPNMLASGVRYIVMCLNSFTSQPYCDLPECFAGWMPRQSPNSGEIFEARTVEQKIDVSANTRICIPAILDLVDQKTIWADIALTSSPRFNNVHNNLSGMSLMLRALQDLPKTSLHTLFSLHIQARGHLVPSPTQATTLFTPTQGITPYDLPQIAANFL